MSKRRRCLLLAHKGAPIAEILERRELLSGFDTPPILRWESPESVSQVGVAALDAGGQTSAPFTWDITDRTLNLFGSDGYDGISLWIDESGQFRMTWSGVDFTRPANEFDGIHIRSGGGYDTLAVQPTVDKQITFDAGDGVDDAVYIHGTEDAETIDLGPGSVALTSDGAVNERLIEIIGVESVAVSANGGDDHFVIDTGNVNVNFQLNGYRGNNSYDIISGPGGPTDLPPGTFFPTPGVRIAGGRDSDHVVVHPGANVRASFYGHQSLDPGPQELDTLNFQTSGEDDVVTLGINKISGGGSAVAYTWIGNLHIQSGAGNDRLVINPVNTGMAYALDGGADFDEFDFVTTPSTNALTNSFWIRSAGVKWGNTTFGHANLEKGRVNGGTGAEVVTIEQTPAIDFDYHGVSGNDKLTIGAGASYTLDADAGLTSSNLTLEVAGGGSAHFTAPQRLGNLVVNGSVSVAPGGGNIVRTPSLTIGAAGLLDLADNDLIVDYSSVSPVGVWAGSAYDGVTGYIQSGRIISSAASGNLTKFGVAEAREALAISGSQTSTFAGQSVDSTSVLVKFTWGGDANLDGKINIDDYGRIDGNVSQSPSVWGWFAGDFNLDGKINIDDYGIIDGNINQQDQVL